MSLEIQKEEPPTFTFDHHHFYRNGIPLFLEISENIEEGNTLFLPISALLQSTLSWEEEKEKAFFAIQKNKYLLWHLDLSWEGRCSVKEKVLFLPTAIQAARAFSEKLAPLFVENTVGVSLFLGEPLKEKEEWLEEIHEMASHLPSNVAPFLFFDLSSMKSYKEQVEFLDKSLLERFVLGLQNNRIFYPSLSWKQGRGNLGIFSGEKEENNPLIGILLPSPLVLEPFWDDLFRELEEKKVKYRLLYQNYATGEWDGLEEIWTFSSCVNKKMERILQGFEAAGGKVAKLSKEFRGRGIRTPDLLVPNQSR